MSRKSRLQKSRRRKFRPQKSSTAKSHCKIKRKLPRFWGDLAKLLDAAAFNGCRKIAKKRQIIVASNCVAAVAQKPTAQPFSAFFAAASDAYYRRARIGEDFITAVSTGALFGACISARARALAAARWGSGRIAWVEFGAAGAELMSDVIAANAAAKSRARAQHADTPKSWEHTHAQYSPPQDTPKSWEHTHAQHSPHADTAKSQSHTAAIEFDYFISEPKEQLQERQRARLGAAVRHVDERFCARRAIIVANELFDALEFELFVHGARMGVSDFRLVPLAKLATTPKSSQIADEIVHELGVLAPQNGELATGVARFLADISARFDEFCLLSFDYACASADRVSTRVFARHLAPLDIREADLAACARGEADITYTIALDQLRFICERLGLELKIQRQASWLIDQGAANLALELGELAALKRLCFGFGESFFAFEISK